MLRTLIDLLRAHAATPEECLGELLACARGAPSPADLELDLRTAMEIGALDGALAGRLLAALDALNPGSSNPPACLASPELVALEAEVAALAARQPELGAWRHEELRRRGEITDKSRQLAELDQRIAQLRAEVAAAEARCDELQARLERTHDEQQQPALV